MTDEELAQLQIGFSMSLQRAVSDLGMVQDRTRHLEPSNHTRVQRAQTDALRHMCDALHYGGLYLVERFDRIEGVK